MKQQQLQQLTVLAALISPSLIQVYTQRHIETMRYLHKISLFLFKFTCKY